jgi:hypothetical protein
MNATRDFLAAASKKSGGEKVVNHITNNHNYVTIHAGGKSATEMENIVKKSLKGFPRAVNAASGGSTAHSASTRGAVPQ